MNWNQLIKLFAGNMGRQKSRKNGWFFVIASVVMALVMMVKRKGNTKSVILNEHRKLKGSLPIQQLAAEFAEELLADSKKTNDSQANGQYNKKFKAGGINE